MPVCYSLTLQGTIKTKAPFFFFLRRKYSGTVGSLETIQFDLWFLLRYVLHHTLFWASFINQNLSHLLNSFLELRHLECRGPASSCRAPWRWATSESFQEGFQVTKWPLYLLMTWAGNGVVFLRQCNLEPWIRRGEGTVSQPSRLSGTADECDLCQKCTEPWFLPLTFACRDPSVKLTHSPGKLKPRQTQFMKARLQAGACACVLRGWRHRNHFKLVSQLCFFFPQAFISILLPPEQEKWESSVLCHPYI